VRNASPFTSQAMPNAAIDSESNQNIQGVMPFAESGQRSGANAAALSRARKRER
jgi:hypothetical protein